MYGLEVIFKGGSSAKSYPCKRYQVFHYLGRLRKCLKCRLGRLCLRQRSASNELPCLLPLSKFLSIVSKILNSG